jgi:hypothetical protein
LGLQRNTWTRDLSFHPHVHTVVTGGGLATDGSTWVPTRENYLFPHRVLSRLFRGKFLAELSRLYADRQLNLRREAEALLDPSLFRILKDRLYSKDWNVYQKPPFGSPEDVFRYLGRYTHRIAISNYRILAVGDDIARFTTKHGRAVSLRHDEFIRRFLLHVLPTRFVRIRHHGLMAAPSRPKLDEARAFLDLNPQQLATQTGRTRTTETSATTDAPGPDVASCPACRTGRLIRRPLRGPFPGGHGPHRTPPTPLPHDPNARTSGRHRLPASAASRHRPSLASQVLPP